MVLPYATEMKPSGEERLRQVVLGDAACTRSMHKQREATRRLSFAIMLQLSTFLSPLLCLVLLLSQALLLASAVDNTVDNTNEKIQDLRNTEVWATLMDNVDDNCYDLLNHPSFNLEDVQYMSSLPRECLYALSTNVASMMQEAVEKSLTEELTKFYKENQPDRAMLSVHVAKLVQKYGKKTDRKKRLYDKLNKKYPGKIPTALKNMLVQPEAEATESVFDGVKSPMDMVRNLVGISKECMDQLRASQDEGKNEGKNYAFSVKCRAELTRAEEMIGETKKTMDGKIDL